MVAKYYGVDLGGTNLRIAEVNPATGNLLTEVQARKLDDVTTNDGLASLISSAIPPGSNVGISAAGDVDEKSLVIKCAPNSRINGELTFARSLQSSGYNVVMTNDMRAMAQAVAQYGEGKDYSTVLLGSYGTGFNAAVVRDGKNLTTAEFGHQVFKSDSDLFCGCGGLGHLETYVSGSGAATMAKQYFSMRPSARNCILELALEELGEMNATPDNANSRLFSLDDLADPKIHALVVGSISGEHVYRAWDEQPHERPQSIIRDRQMKAIADSFGKMVSAYNPVDLIVVMGGQTKNWQALFQPAILLYRNVSEDSQLSSLPKPPIVKTALSDIGIKGSVAYLLSYRPLL